MPQSKPSESKTVGFFAGRVPYLCYFTNYGDYLAMHGLPVDADWETPFMFADMHCARPGETVGGYLKAVVRETATKDYQSVAVDCHEGVNAQGIRVGVCNVLARHVPASFAMCNTGHSSRLKLQNWRKSRVAAEAPAPAPVSAPDVTVIAAPAPAPLGGVDAKIVGVLAIQRVDGPSLAMSTHPRNSSCFLGQIRPGPLSCRAGHLAGVFFATPRRVLVRAATRITRLRGPPWRRHSGTTPRSGGAAGSRIP